MRPQLLPAWLILIGLLLLPICSNASPEVEALLRQAESVRSSDPDRFQRLVQALDGEKARATREQQEQIAYLRAYGDAYAGRYDVSTPALQRLIDTSPDVEMQFRAGALMVNNHAVTRRFTEGLRQLEQTLALADQVRDPELRLHVLGVASVLYNEIGQYQLSLQYAEQILARPASPRAHCFAGQFRLEALWNLKILPVDDAPILRAIGQCTALDEKVLTNLLRGLLARKWANEGKRDKAIVLLRQHLGEVQATHYPRLIGEIHSLLAELLASNGDADGAERHAQLAIAHRADMTQSMPLVMAYKTMYEIAERRGDPVAALAQYRKYAEADKAYLNEAKARELAYQFVRQETEQKTAKIDLLKRQNRLLQLERKVERQSANNNRFLMALLAMLVAALAYWAYKVKRVQMSLRRFAETDALTGVSNRHHFTQQAEQMLVQSARDGEPCALVMFDLDHFKVINDSYGHVTGDWVLKKVADTCSGHCRRIDQIGRLGGEEFGILLRGIDLPAATRLAEDCRVRMAQIDTRESGHTFVVTASFGVSATPLSGYNLTKLLSHADQMLYRAKRAGRNRVQAFVADTLHPQLQVVSRNELPAARDAAAAAADEDGQENLGC